MISNPALLLRHDMCSVSMSPDTEHPRNTLGGGFRRPVAPTTGSDRDGPTNRRHVSLRTPVGPSRRMRAKELAMTHARTGGQLVVDQLVIHGADLVFCVPGESYLAVLDALYDVRDRVRLVNARHEAGAANMAEAYGKLTGRPGIAMVTRGPGACQAAVGVHTAAQDSTPMVLLIGQIPRGSTDREAFQEVDYRQMFGPLAKWVAQVDQAERVPEYLARAFHVAASGRPGPVVLGD